MEKSVIIVAGGLGTRMGSKIPKQFLVVHDKTVIEHTIDAFLDFDSAIQIVVVVHSDYLKTWSQIKADRSDYGAIKETIGGKTRFDSVKNGLDLLSQANNLVGIHDAARPIISKELLNRCYGSAEKNGNAVPCISSVESLRMVERGENSILDRSKVVRIQTPQCFRLNDLKEAYEFKYQDNFTDDASVIENNGESINLVDGDLRNIKITTPEDLEYFKFILDQQAD